ncbi:hydantoinase B/oxoprolinase family protein [Salinigranum salinum]|uniref:hydantoinase B/oxoprolinase family protein n=1 Tax=Salinigranum salinum TaxID=1364937 RepID=UPI00195B9F83|nr:hydantoinase B/oxoprolinase family protein [Salinigranum salinum]
MTTPTGEAGSADAGLSLDGIDPVTFQIIKHRLEQVTDEAVEALKRVSGAPNTNEGHDLMVALYTPDGDLLTGGVGFLHHYLGASEATKHVIETFAGDIGPGDMFMLNDPYTAALHPPDVYIISPIFYEGELQAFSASFVHVADIGAVDPGGFAPNSTSVFHEGFQTPGLKLIDGGEMREDVLATIKNMSRDPGMIELDLRSQIAANNVANERLQSLADDYGAATVERVGRELIRQSGERFRSRLRELPDGRFETRQYLDSVAEERDYEVRLALEKEGDSLTFDFAGTDEQSEYGLNCTYIATYGGVLAPVFPLFCYDMTWNDGIIQAVDVEAPRGSIVNAERPAPISIATVATLQMCNSLSTLAVSKLVGASETHADRATGVWHGAHCHVSMEVDRGDDSSVETLTDTFAGAGGARAFDDGVDLGGEVVNVVARWGNAERHEATVPLRYVQRRYVPDSGGAGEYRGGVGHEYALAPVPGVDVESIDVVTIGRGLAVPHSTGVFGGYPGSTTDYRLFHDVGNVSGTFDPQEAGEGDPAAWGVHRIEDDDVFYLRFPGSGGYGDPLDRPPEKIAADVASGKVTPETAARVYGVPVDAEGTIDGSVEETREAIRAERLAEASAHMPPVPADETAPAEAGTRLGPNVAVVVADGDRYAACDACGTVLADARENWKDSVAVVERPLSHAGAHTNGSDAFCLREFSCPDCATLLDTEVARVGDEFLTSRLY